MSKIKLGDYVRCKVTGFEGTATSKTEHLNSCVRWGVQPRVDQNGNLPDAYSIDEIQLELVKKLDPPAKAVKTGGPITREKRR